jgi:hypothetical protein
MMRTVVPILVLALGGCSAAQCDPSQADFFSGIGCTGGGGYAQRTKALQNTLATEQTWGMAALQQAGEQEQAAAAAEAEAEVLRRKISDMQRSQVELRQKLAAAQQRRGAQPAYLQRARRELDQLDTKLREQQTGVSPDPATMRQIERDQNQLLQQISRL